MHKKIIWFAMTISVLVYGGLIFYFENYSPIPVSGDFDPNTLFYILAFVALMNFLFQFGVTRLPIQDDMAKSIIRYGLLESVGVLGLVAYILTGYFEESFIFLGVSLLGLIIAAPFWESKTL